MLTCGINYSMFVRSILCSHIRESDADDIVPDADQLLQDIDVTLVDIYSRMIDSVRAEAVRKTFCFADGTSGLLEAFFCRICRNGT